MQNINYLKYTSKVYLANGLVLPINPNAEYYGVTSRDGITNEMTLMRDFQEDDFIYIDRPLIEAFHRNNIIQAGHKKFNNLNSKMFFQDFYPDDLEVYPILKKYLKSAYIEDDEVPIITEFLYKHDLPFDVRRLSLKLLKILDLNRVEEIDFNLKPTQKALSLALCYLNDKHNKDIISFTTIEDFPNINKQDRQFLESWFENVYKKALKESPDSSKGVEGRTFRKIIYSYFYRRLLVASDEEVLGVLNTLKNTTDSLVLPSFIADVLMYSFISQFYEGNTKCPLLYKTPCSTDGNKVYEIAFFSEKDDMNKVDSDFIVTEDSKLLIRVLKVV